MSNHEHGEVPPGYKGRLEFLLAKLQGHTQRMEDLRAARSRTWAEVSDSIKEFGITEETKFIIAAFAGYPTDPEKIECI